MTQQFENPDAAKLEDATIAEKSAQEKIEHIADKAAARPIKTEQKYDSDHTIFTI